MSEREAWLWMLSQAAYADTTHRVAGEAMAVPRGSFMVTLRDLQSTFMWGSDTKVRNFLKRLKKERMIRWEIVGRKNAPKTHVTICNYEAFQATERTDERTGKRTENAPSGTVNKQDNNITTSSNEEDGQAVDGEVVDFAKEVFDRAVAYLGRHGIKNGAARGIVGKWRKSSDDAQIFDALKSASKAGVTDPVPYVTAILKPKAQDASLEELFQGIN